MSGTTSQSQNGTRVKQRNPFGPSGISMVSSEVVYDTIQYGQGPTEVLQTKTSLFNTKERIGADKWFLCNLAKAGELPYGSAREVFGISLYAHFRDNVIEADPAQATAEELYDLIQKWTYIEIIKNNKDTVAKIPTFLIPQFNSVGGTSGAAGAAKYNLGRGMHKLMERITLEAGEQFEALLIWSDDRRGEAAYALNPRARYNAALNVEKFFRLNLHTVAFDRPSIN